jgi:hypothetical protein
MFKINTATSNEVAVLFTPKKKSSYAKVHQENMEGFSLRFLCVSGFHDTD